MTQHHHIEAHSDLKKHGLHVVEIAQTPLGDEASSILHSADTDPQSNKALAAALRIYGKHYLASQDGIPGEGETIDVILARLRGEDEHVKAMTVYGLADDEGNIHGAAFVETYHIDTHAKDGSRLEGLTHLMTYAAANPGYNDYEHNAAFHAGIVDHVRETDKKLGFEGNSLLTTEVNATRDYDGKPTSNKMDGEFEIKTGAKRAEREAYVHGTAPSIITVTGNHNHAHILQMPYTPPNLSGEDSESLAHITTAGELAKHLRNNDVYNGEGEPLFLTAERPDGTSLTARDIELQRAFQNKLLVSVMGDSGITDSKLILEARDQKAAGFGSMNEGYDALRNQLANPDMPSHGIAKREGGWAHKV